MKKTAFILLAISMISFIFVMGPAVALAKDKPVVLKGLSCFPANNPSTIIFLEYAKAVDKASNGLLKIEFKGGPEAMKPRDQPENLKNGVIDIIQSTGSNVSPIVPEGLCLFITGNDATTNRKNGFFDLYDGYYMANGLKFIAHDGDGMTFAIFSSKPVSRLSDLKGQILRSNRNYDPFFKALGCSTVSMASTEMFNALQGGIVDGYGVPAAAMPTYGLIDLTKTYIQHGLWNGSANIVMNLDAYNKLSPELQKVLKDVTIAREEATREFWHDEKAKAEEKIKKTDIDIVKFSPDEAKTYLDLSMETCWDYFLKANPVSGPKLKKATMAPVK